MEPLNTMERTSRLIALAGAMMLSMFFTLVPTAGAADTAKVAGEWAINVETPQGSGTPSVVFKQDGETLTGTYKGRLGEVPLKGTITGNDIKFSVTVSPQGQELVIEYKGTVDGDTMKGKAKFGDFGEGNFTGKKKAADAK
jgi:hypothetical protein